MSKEYKSREVVQYVPDTFELRPNKDATKEPVVSLKVRVVEGETKGRDQVLYMNLQGGAAEFTFKSLRALGMTNNDITAPEGLGSLRADMLGYDDTYNGKTSRKHDIYATRPKVSLREEDQKAFAKAYREKMAQVEAIKRADFNAAGDLPEAVAGATAQKFDSSDTGSSATDLFR